MDAARRGSAEPPTMPRPQAPQPLLIWLPHIGDVELTPLVFATMVGGIVWVNMLVHMGMTYCGV